MELLRFGDIVWYRGGKHVYLAYSAPDILFLAKILSREDEITQAMLKRIERDDHSFPERRRNANNALFCFVVLKTETHSGDLAHLARPSNPLQEIRAAGYSLEEADIVAIKEKILSEDTIPPKLKELITQAGS